MPTKIRPVATQAEALKARAQGTILWAIWDRMRETELVDRSVGLAGKAFTSFFPLVITVAAFLPLRLHNAILDEMADRFGLTGAAFATVKHAFQSQNEIRRGAGLFGLVLTIFFASSFTTALERIYLRAWRRPDPVGARFFGPYIRGISWVGAFLVYMAVLGFARELLWGGVLIVLFLIVAAIAATGIWWFTAWLMLGSQVRLRVLIPSGLVTGLAMSAFALSTSLWMPFNVTQNQQQFGLFGVTLALITWFSGSAICVVIGACAGPVLAEDSGSIGRLIRGSADVVLVDGAQPSLPAALREAARAAALSITDDDATPE